MTPSHLFGVLLVGILLQTVRRRAERRIPLERVRRALPDLLRLAAQTVRCIKADRYTIVTRLCQYTGGPGNMQRFIRHQVMWIRLAQAVEACHVEPRLKH